MNRIFRRVGSALSAVLLVFTLIVVPQRANAVIIEASELFLQQAALSVAESVGMNAAVSGMTAAEVSTAMGSAVSGYAAATGTTAAALAETVGTVTTILTPKTIIIGAAGVAVLFGIINYMIAQHSELETVGTPAVIASGTSFLGLPVGKVGSARYLLGSYYYTLENQGLTFDGSSITVPALADHSGGQVLYTLSDGVQIVAGVSSSSDTYLDIFARAPNGNFIGTFVGTQYTRRSNSYTFVQGVWTATGLPFFGVLQNGGNNEWASSQGQSENLFESNTGLFRLSQWDSNYNLYTYYNGTGELIQYSFNFTRSSDFELPQLDEDQFLQIQLPEGVTLDPSSSADDVLSPIVEAIASNEPSVLPAQVVDSIPEPSPDFDPEAPPVGGGEDPDGDNPEDYPTLPTGFGLDFTGVWHYVVEALAFVLPFISTAMLTWTTVMPGSVQILVWASIVLAIMFAIIKRLLG